MQLSSLLNNSVPTFAPVWDCQLRKLQTWFLSFPKFMALKVTWKLPEFSSAPHSFPVAGYAPRMSGGGLSMLRS